jgi:hypothetical protein
MALEAAAKRKHQCQRQGAVPAADSRADGVVGGFYSGTRVDLTRPAPRLAMALDRRDLALIHQLRVNVDATSSSTNNPANQCIP